MTAFPIRTAVKTAFGPTQTSPKHSVPRKGEKKIKACDFHKRDRSQITNWNQTTRWKTPAGGPGHRAINKAAAVRVRRASVLPSTWVAQSHRLRARSSDVDLGEGRCRQRGDHCLWKEVFGEAGAAFESFFSSVVQRRQPGWWENTVPQKELI